MFMLNKISESESESDKLVNHLQMAVILFSLIKGLYVYIWQSCKIL